MQRSPGDLHESFERTVATICDRSGEPEHLAFGAGPHLCLGNHLTRMIGRVILEEVLDRFTPGQLQLVDGFVWECVNHPLEYGPEHLPVHVV